MMRVTQDEHGVVSLYREDGSLFAFMWREDYNQMCRSLGEEPLEPEPTVSGGGVIYGLRPAAAQKDKP